MKYERFDNLNLPVSKIILGTSTAPCCKGENCDEVFNAAYEAGITTFDTARVYGKSEETLGDWLQRSALRDKINILSKGGHHSPLLKKRLKEKDILFDLELSLRKLKTDHIDIYLLHRDDPKVSVGEIVEMLNGLYEKGKIKEFGGSNWSKERIEQANEYAYKHNLKPFTFSSPYFGLAEMKESFFAYGLIGLTGKEKEEDRKWYAENRMPVVAYSTLASGLFSGKVEKRMDIHPFWARIAFGDKTNFERLARCEELAKKKGCTVAELAIAFSLHSEMNVFPIVGASKAKHVLSAVRALNITLDEDERVYLTFKN